MDHTDTDDHGPRTINDLVGQRQVVEPLNVALDATWCSPHPAPHILFCGPAGLGKTEFAKTFARELGTQFRQTLGQSIRTGAEMAGFLMAAEERDILFIDEFHELRAEAQTQLYRAMTERLVFVGGGPFGRNVHCVPVSRFSLLAATTNPALLTKPLRDRFDMILHFTFYTPDELAEILRRHIQRARLTVSPEVPLLVGQRSKGVPRSALRLLNACGRVMNSRGDMAISIETFQKMCRIEHVDELGLDAVEWEYLQILESSREPVRPTLLAAKLGLPLHTVLTMAEEFLIRAGLVEKTPKGRVLTPKGICHVKTGHMTPSPAHPG
jgi:Holliday junction DNA helicase RuvB